MSKEFDVCLESDLPIVQQQGLNTNKNAFLGGTLNVTGAVSLNSTLSVTGAVSLQSTLGAAGIISAVNATAIAAGGAQAFGLSSTSTMGVYFGSGAPTVSAATGSLYLRSDGAAATNRAYVNTGGTAWTAITTQA